jgi:CheY-like chemotaxis protein
MPFHVLIVDDEPSILDTLKDILETREFEVSTAASANDAIRQLGQLAFDLVLTDMRMESSTAGYEVVRKATSLSPRPVVVILTAFPIPSIEWRASGADALYIKGGGIMRILDDLEQLLLARERNARSA